METASTNLNKVTIIIPAHNRPERLKRLLDYYQGTPLHIIVTDSSKNIFKFDPNLYPNTTYYHFPNQHFLLKLREILPYINTPYVLYCADDDFAVIHGIETVVDFLEKNPSYSIAQGHYLTFTPRKSSVKFVPRYATKHFNHIEGNTPKERLEKENQMYGSLLYGITRTDIFKEMYSHCFDSNGNRRFSNLFLAEEFFNHAVLMYGNYSTIPVFFSAREYIIGSATTTTTPSYTIKNNPSYQTEFEGFIYALAEIYSKKQSLPIQEATDFLKVFTNPPQPRKTPKQKLTDWLYSLNIKPISQFLMGRYEKKALKATQSIPSYPSGVYTSGEIENQDINRIVRNIL